MLASDLGFLVKGDLLPREQIAAFCKEAGYQCRGIPLHTGKEPDGPILAWVKYGPTVTRAEALTQDWVAKALDADPEAPVRVPRVHDFFTIRTLYSTIGHIVMEHVAAPNCAESDVELVAKAVEWLIRVPAPTSVPGPVGGGPVVHSFFYDWASHITYHTVDELQDHVNGILKVKGDRRQVDFKTESSDGLYLCPCDINPGNFKKDVDDKLIALDFSATVFLPRSFFAFVVARPVNNFAWSVVQHLTSPASSNVEAMVAASTFLVPRGKNTIGLSQNVRARMQR